MFAPDFAHNVELESAYKQYINSREYAELSEEQREFLKLITCEFAKSKPANGYAVSNIVFDYYKSKGYQSIAYPGIQSKYRANNIAITPYIVDNNLVCYQAAEFCLCQTEAGDISIRHAYKIEIEDNHRLKYSSFNESEIGENIKLEI